jgi:DNA-binding transcriptional LysR family regulator
MDANRADATEALRDGSADLAIMGRAPAGLSAEARVFGENRLLLLCAPSHELAGSSPKLDEVASSPFLLREKGSGTRAAIEQLFASQGLELQRTMVLGSNSAVLAAVREGLGLAVMPEIAAQEHIRNGDLVELDAPQFPMLRQWHIVWLTARPPSSPATAFMAMLSDAEEP